MAEKVTKMSIKVDLQCSRCYRKIKKILCEFPQIRDQTYDEKQNVVLITVVCCSPEKIRQKIICKGGETVLSVEILPDKPKESKKLEDTKKPKVVVGCPPVPVYPMVGVCCCPPCFGGYGGGPCYCGRRIPVMCYDGCGRPAEECQGGNRGFHPGQGGPVMCDDGCGRPACECQGGNRGYRVSLCDYLSEENATACTVM
ncbi:protein PYRICULARIA ORYZAE RESISTANCE 21-like [Syzygium oleosum]|uniref:protein PYRICULARIA ORYZAE RESISTANCE 21-like n=1 Tax=Syzygium oleosum TaxID=219896 RepID=UPI0024BA15BF|nr:protein PYRICULARIA ORYZAE RESISTANCE 21-like [Syzygium oleosum]